MFAPWNLQRTTAYVPWMPEVFSFASGEERQSELCWSARDLCLRQLSLFERADPITLPFISPESKFDPGDLIGRLKKRFLKGLLLVKCTMILAKPVLPKCENRRLRMSIKGDWRQHGSEVVIAFRCRMVN